VNIDKLMDDLINQGIDFKTLSKAYDNAADRKKDAIKITEARANVMQALRKYVTVLYGSCDEEIMNEFESTLKGLEQMSGKPTSFKMEMGQKKNESDVDEEKLRKFLEAMTKF